MTLPPGREAEIRAHLEKSEWWRLSTGQMLNDAEDLLDLLDEERAASARWKMLALDAGVVE
ncbi:MAG: hypothetical protein ACYDCK_01600 [Thermoplasmatota archaeon]